MTSLEHNNFGDYLNVDGLRRNSCPPKPNLQEDFTNDEWIPKRSSSLETSPTMGIRLGSKTAQLAAKSFWNMEMFKDSLQKIAEYAAIESSSLGSSLESISDENEEDPLSTSGEVENTLLPIAPHLIDLPFSLTPRSNPCSPTHSPLLPLKRSKSACSERKTSPVKRTIPRKISPAAYSPTSAAKVRFQLSGSQNSLPDVSERHGSTDDGYYER